MEVLRLIAPRGDPVNVHIEQRVIENSQIRQPRLFMRLPECYSANVGIPVTMPSELKPEVEFAVVCKKHL